MGFYIRKAVTVGPFRFNLSKSGIGISAGIKGLRIGSGPRGNYIHMGRGGLYYRKTLPAGTIPAPISNPVPLSEPRIPEVTLTEIESADVSTMSDSSSVELLEEINLKAKRARLAPWSVGTLALILYLAWVNNAPHWVEILLVIVGLPLVVYAHIKDQLSKTVVMLYELEAEAEAAFQKLHDAFHELSICCGTWHIEASGAVSDSKYHAGANQLVRRQNIGLLKKLPPFFKSNVEIPAIPVGKQILFFFPDRVLFYSNTGVGAVNYADMRLEVSRTKFVEDGSVPKDAEIVGRTWRYVNKSGGPDKRFKDNKELPIALYEEIHFTSSSGVNELIQISRTGVAEDFAEAVASLVTQTNRSPVIA